MEKETRNDCMIQEDSIDKIKLLLSEFADEDDVSLKETIEKIIKDTLTQISSIEHDSYHRKLINRFPLVTDIYNNSYQYAQSSTLDPLKVIDSFKDYDKLIERLSSIYSSSDLNVRNKIVEKFKATEIWEKEPVMKAKNTDTPKIEVESNDYLTTLMAEFLNSLSPFIWSLWSNMNPGSKFMSSGILEKQLKVKSMNSSKYKHTKEAAELNKLKLLTTSILTSINSLGGKIMMMILPRISPERIESDVRIEGTNFLTSMEVKCWKKYKQRYREQFDPEWMETEVRNIVSSEINSFLRTLNHSK
jgi:hypothetical protein